MARKTNQKFQHAAARRELEAKGASEAEIQALERGWNIHTARSLDPSDPYPAGR